MKPLLKIVLTFSVTLFISCGIFAAYLLTGRSGAEGVTVSDKAGWGEKNLKKNESQPEIFTDTEGYYKGVKIGKEIILPADFKEINILESCIGYHYLAGQTETGKALYSSTGKRLTQSMYTCCGVYENDGRCYFYLVTGSASSILVVKEKESSFEFPLGGDSFSLLNDKYEVLAEAGYDFECVKRFHGDLAIIVRRGGAETIMNIKTQEYVLPFSGLCNIFLWSKQNIFIATGMTNRKIFLYHAHDGSRVVTENGEDLRGCDMIGSVVSEDGVTNVCSVRLYFDNGREDEWEQMLYDICSGAEVYEGIISKSQKIAESDARIKANQEKYK